MNRLGGLLLAALVLSGCNNDPGPLEPVPNAALPAPTSKVSPEPGPFNGEVELTFETPRTGATLYVSVDGSDPRTSSKTRLSGPSPLKVTLKATTEVKWFASEGGKDEDLRTGTWTRAGGPVGTISGQVIVGSFLQGKAIGVARNFSLKQLGNADGPFPQAIPFLFENVAGGQHTLTALGDRSGDGQLIPVLDLSSPQVSVTLDLEDPFKASAENVTLYLASSAAELGTLRGTVYFPTPPGGQALRMAALSADAFTSGFDANALLAQLQNGYQLFTNGNELEYPYVITDLQPGSYMPTPVMLGLGNGGLALNLIANPLRPAIVRAGAETISDHYFGPVSLTGRVVIHPDNEPTGVVYGVVAAKNASLTDGAQVVLMPTIFTFNEATMQWEGAYGGTSLRANASFQLRAFPSLDSTSNPLIEALTWAVNPLSGGGQATVQTGNSPIVKDIDVP